MWIEVTGRESKDKFMLNFDLLETVHPYPGGGTKCVAKEGNMYIVTEDYEEIKNKVLRQGVK